ncbi:unnamed protein product, partial [Toxocara canis]
MQSNIGIPWCYFPPNTGYVKSSTNGTEITLKLFSHSPKSPFGKTIDQIILKQRHIGSTLNVRIGQDERWECCVFIIIALCIQSLLFQPVYIATTIFSYVPPIHIPRHPSHSSETLSLIRGGRWSKITKNVYSFTIKRGSGKWIWDTSIGGMLFADQYIQIATLLPSDKIYGFGENVHKTLKHSFDAYKTWGMFARHQSSDLVNVSTGHNLYGVHPFYLGLESDNKAHGVLIWNSNAQEVTTAVGPHLVYRTIGGMLDIYFFPGPKPEQVIQQYQMLIGTPFLPAYWALGFQLGGNNFKTLSDLQAAVNRTTANKMPLDVIHAGIDYMDRYKDFTIGQSWIGLNDYAKELHTNGLTLTLVVDPTVQADSSAFQRALEQDVGFIEWPQTELVQTEVNQIHPLAKETKIMFGIGRSDRHVAFPDFLDPLNKTTAWWMDEIKQLHFTANFDGVWLDMNEPANLGADKHRHSKWDRKQLAPLKCPLTGLNAHFDVPPYQTANVYQWGFENVLSTKTLCMLATTSRNKTRFYDTKNLYGLSQTIATQTAINYATAKRGLVVSRSTFPSSGHYAGHWIDGTIGRWEDLRTSLIAIQEFNMFGIPYVGSNVHTICNSDVADELCIRWQQLGAFQSLSRYHNGNIGAPYNPKVLEAIRQANLFRYQYLPYLYSLHFNASMKGGSVLRPVFFEFPDDKNTHDLGYQFMWGSAVMVVPAVYPGQNTVSGYLPTGAIWYSLRETEYGQLVQGGHQEFSARIDELPPVFLK